MKIMVCIIQNYLGFIVPYKRKKKKKKKKKKKEAISDNDSWSIFFFVESKAFEFSVEEGGTYFMLRI